MDGDCDGCNSRSAKSCSDCANMLLYQAGCQLDGVQLASNKSRRTTQVRNANAKIHLAKNPQRRFEDNIISLEELAPQAKVFFPAV